MTSRSIRAAAASLVAIAIAGCTTTRLRHRPVRSMAILAQFQLDRNRRQRADDGRAAHNGQVFQGPFFQITSESIADYGPLWNGWGPGYGWGRGWGGRCWGYGWGGWGPWGPDMTTITHYSGQVLANLQGPGGFMRCDFR